MNHRITALSAAIALMTTCHSRAQITETKLTASDQAENDHFGYSVSLSGDYALVGAWLDDDNGTDAGSAYIFHFDGSNWVEQAKLLPGDGATDDHFGYSVSLEGTYALVGAGGDDDKGVAAGAAYIFRYDGSAWVEQAKLLASDGVLLDYFGGSVSLSGNYALIGADGDDDNGVNAGSAYIFHFDGSNWVEQTKLLASDGEAADYFGKSVTLLGHYALVGAPWDDDNGGSAGSVYIFYFYGSNWIEQPKLLASDGATGDAFGKSVALQSYYALVGAPGDDDNGGSAGSAYIFHFDGSYWIEQTKLLASDGERNEEFGNSVSLSGSYALVGAWREHDGTNVTGSAYIFRSNGSDWIEQTKLIASDALAGDHFGVSVSLSGNYALVGAHGDDVNGTDVGATYVYSATPLCSRVSQFQARCRPGGLIKARVTMADTSHTGEVIEISIDDVPYEVTIDATGRGQLSQSGFSSGPHTVELTNPGQCFDPIVVTCRTGLDEEASDDWDDELVSETPMETALLGNYPNPFNPSTTIRYALSNDVSVSIRVYNMLGQEVATLVDGFQKAGEQSVTWHGTNNFGQSVASGLYIYRLQAGSITMSQKMLFAK